MDAADSRADDARDAFLVELRERLEALLTLPRTGLCGPCRGSGLCPVCEGHGRFLVRDLGTFACPACIGDGACLLCDGSGKVRCA